MFARFGKFGGGALGVAGETVSGGKRDTTPLRCRSGAACPFEQWDCLLDLRQQQVPQSEPELPGAEKVVARA